MTRPDTKARTKNGSAIPGVNEGLIRLPEELHFLLGGQC